MSAALARGATLLDARPRHHYDGRVDSPRTGHIPGAVSTPYPELVDGDTGRFRSTPELRSVFAAAGIDPADGRHIVASCGGGISATVPVLALELLGRRDVPVYDGSFAEWVADGGRPVTQTKRVDAD